MRLNGAVAGVLALAAGVGAAASYAALVIGTKHTAVRTALVPMELWTYTVAAAVLAPFLAGAGRLAPTPREAGYLVLLGALYTACSGLVYVWLLRRVTAQAIGVLAYLEVVSAALLAWAILGQSLGWAVLVGGALVIAGGVAVVVLEPRVAAPVEAAPAR